MNHALNRSGFELLSQCLRSEHLESLRSDFSPELSGYRAGQRNLLAESAPVRDLATGAMATLLRQFGLINFFPVRALFFDKTPKANWNVSWHQDLSIPVADRIEAPGFSGWSRKEGVWHVQPPAEILERMITVRLHLDDCGPEHGPLRVIPGSHRNGRLNSEAVAEWRAKTPTEDIVCRAGDALLMRPLLLHASSKAIFPSRRRILHIEYAAESLPGELTWAASTASRTVTEPTELGPSFCLLKIET